MAKKRTGKELLMSEARTIARQEGVPPALLLALVTAESNWDPNAGSPAGARGLTQLMPGTARGLGVRDVLNPVQNLRGGARYLRQQLDQFGSPELALSAYNSGPGGAEASGRVEPFAETQAYVQRVMALEAQYAKMGAGAGVMGLPPSPLQAEPPAGAAGPVGLGERLQEGGGAGTPTFGDLVRRMGPESSAAVNQVIQTAQSAAGTDASQGGGEPTMAPGDAGAPPQTDGGTPAVGGMNAEFIRRFDLLQKAVRAAGGDITIYSGARDQKKQASLYQAALAKYGSESEARKWVAPPGKSNHDLKAGLKYGFGDGAVAGDIRGDIALAHKLAPRFGLIFPLANEAWHIELAGIRDMK